MRKWKLLLAGMMLMLSLSAVAGAEITMQTIKIMAQTVQTQARKTV